MAKYLVLYEGVIIDNTTYNSGDVVELKDLSLVNKPHYLEFLIDTKLEQELIETGDNVELSEQTNKPSKKGKRGNKQW